MNSVSAMPTGVVAGGGVGVGLPANVGAAEAAPELGDAVPSLSPPQAESAAKAASKNAVAASEDGQANFFGTARVIRSSSLQEVAEEVFAHARED